MVWVLINIFPSDILLLFLVVWVVIVVNAVVIVYLYIIVCVDICAVCTVVS